MRIIAGTARGRLIETVKGQETRPTADRVKESLFSILQTRIGGAEVLDLFAGSGALGLEAISRGAAHAVFADRSMECVRIIRKNADRLALAKRCAVLQGDYEFVIKRLQAEGRRFDIVFLDPPYKSGFLPRTLDLLFGFGLMRDGAVAACEHGAELAIENDVLGRYAVFDRRRYGSTVYSFISERKED